MILVPLALLLLPGVGKCEGNRLTPVSSASEDDDIELLFLFMILSVLTGVFFKFFQKYIHYEYTPIILIIGMIFGFFFDKVGEIGKSLEYVGNIDGHSLLLIFIPLLIFESSFTADTHTFMKSIWQILVLAFPAVICSIFFISLTFMYVLGYHSTFNWGMALSLSSILAATDPVAVVAILKSTGAKIQLHMIIEGESLLNDGSASIFFFVFVDLILNSEFSFATFFVKFCRLTLGGSALGLLCGMIVSPLMKSMNNDNLVVIFSFIATYLTFFLAESSMVGLRVSGILAVVVLGLYLGAYVRPRLNPHYTHTLHSVWSFAQFMMETLLFLLTGGYIGIFVAEKKLGVTAVDVGKMIGFNFILLLIRFFVIAIFWPILNCIGYRITWKEYIIMGWSGLRGAIALAIGLIVSLDYRLPEVFRNLSILYISGVIIFTVLIQGMTLKLVMRLIGYNRMGRTKERLYKDLRRRFFLHMLEKSENLRENKQTSYQVCWPSVYQIFHFPKYILDFGNLESGGKPLMLDYDYRRDVDVLVELHVDKLDHMISDDEIDTYNDMVNYVRQQEFQSWRDNHLENQAFLANQEDSVLSEQGLAQKFQKVDNLDFSQLTQEDQLDMSSLTRQDIQIEKANEVSLTHRKAMLRKVVSDLYKFTVQQRETRETNLRQQDSTQEMRMRVYKILKNLVWEKFEHRMCESDTLVKLHRLLDICKDNLKSPIHCFDVYSKIYTATFTERALANLSKIPLLGRLFYGFLVERVYMRYDLLLMMTITLAELVESKQFLRQEFANWQVIVKEIQFELNNFEMSQTALLQAHELLVKAVQTKNVGKTILNFGYQSLERLHKSGEIDDLERAALMKHLLRVESELRFVEKYIRKNVNNERKRSKKQADSEDPISGEDQIAKIRQLAVKFPVLKELPLSDLESFYEVLSKHQLESHHEEIICQSDEGEFGTDQLGAVYLVESGMFKIRSSTDRTIRHVSCGDVFGSVQLISDDVPVLASPMSKTVYYRIPLSFLQGLMAKSPLLEKQIYLWASYDYLKSCPYSQAKKKTKYFRRLRRISYFHLKKIFDNGLILRFQTSKEFLGYLFQHNYSSLGLFVLMGGIRIQHQNVKFQKARRLFKFKEMASIQEFLEDRTMPKSPKHDQQSNLLWRIAPNLFSVRKIASSSNHSEIEKPEEIRAGNAVEVQTHYLEDIEILGSNVVVFLLETKSMSFEDKDHLADVKKLKVNKINRRKYL